MSFSRRTIGTALEIAVPVLVLVMWWIWSSSSTSLFYPTLKDILQSFSDTWLFERFGSDVVPSLARMLAGFGLAASLGVGLGVPLGHSLRARRAAAPIVEFLRSIPAPALIPPAIVLAGTSDASKVLLIGFLCVWPILLNTLDGVAAIDTTLRETARLFQIPARQQLLRLVLPSASPQIFAGMRTSLSLALIMMIISEMVSSTNGIGYFVVQAQTTFAIADMWSGIVLLGLLGYLLNLIFSLVERRALAWHRGARAQALD